MGLTLFFSWENHSADSRFSIRNHYFNVPKPSKGVQTNHLISLNHDFIDDSTLFFTKFEILSHLHSTLALQRTQFIIRDLQINYKSRIAYNINRLNNRTEKHRVQCRLNLNLKMEIWFGRLLVLVCRVISRGFQRTAVVKSLWSRNDVQWSEVTSPLQYRANSRCRGMVSYRSSPERAHLWPVPTRGDVWGGEWGLFDWLVN